LDELGIDGRTIIKMILKKERGRRGVAWIDPTHKGDGWRAVVNTVMNLQVSQNAANILTSREILVFSRRVPWKQLVVQLVIQSVS